MNSKLLLFWGWVKTNKCGDEKMCTRSFLALHCPCMQIISPRRLCKLQNNVRLHSEVFIILIFLDVVVHKKCPNLCLQLVASDTFLINFGPSEVYALSLFIADKLPGKQNGHYCARSASLSCAINL